MIVLKDSESSSGLQFLIKKLHEDAVIPAYANPGDAATDLVSIEDAVLQPGERRLFSTGIALALPEGHAAFIQPRSGSAAKHGISVVNTPGLIDSGYRGEIKVILINLDPNRAFNVTKGDRIAQMVIQKVETPTFKEVDALPESVRGEGGFGSTGGLAQNAETV